MRLISLTFFLALLVSVPAWGASASHAYYGDFNGDGEIDVYIAPENKLLPMVVPTSQLLPLAPQYPPMIVWSIGMAGQSSEILSNSTLAYRRSLIKASEYTGSVFIGDFDGDGESDIFVQAPIAGMPSLQWFSYSNSSHNVRAFEDIDGISVSADEAVVTLFDRNGDGRTDITVSPLNEVLSYTSLAGLDGEWLDVSVVSTGLSDPMDDSLYFLAAAVPGGADVVNGAANYSIPINLVPGSAGLAPELSLNYSSEAGYSYLGMGFSMPGFDNISRCPTDYLRSGVIKGVQYDNTDRLCFGGNPLILVSGSHFSNGAEYRTEAETYQKIIYHTSNGGWFSVLTKDGLDKRYGFAAGSAMTIGSVKAQWALDRVADRVGTYYIIEYVADGTAARPLKISYSFNDSVPAVSGYAEVLFNYEDDSYKQKYYRHGSLLDQSGLLTSIVNKLDGNVVSEYKFGYSRNPITGRARVERVYQCGADSYCALPTVLAWTDGGGAGFDAEIVTPISTQYTEIYEGYTSWADINRDGNADYCRIQSGNPIQRGKPYNDTIYRHKPICSLGDGAQFNQSIELDKTFYSLSDLNGTQTWIDINSDGYPDFCYFYGDSGKEKTKCMLSSSGESFASETLVAEPAKPGVPGSSVLARYWVDFNADGAVDLCIVHSGGGYWLRCALSTFNASKTIGFSDFVLLGEVWRYSKLNFADVNGDSLPDVCYGKKNELRCVLNVGGTSIADFNQAGEGHWLSTSVMAGSEMRTQFVDFNGDSYLDWCRVVKNGGHRAVCTLGTGVGWGDELISPAIPVGGALSIWTDINDDGRADWCRNYEGKIRCIISKGYSFGHDLVVGTAWVDGAIKIINDSDEITASTTDQDRTFTDLDGDGVMEYCQFRSTESDAAIECYAMEEKELSDYLLSAVNGFGLKTEFDYASIRDPEVYSYQEDMYDGILDVTGSLIVVKNVTVSGPSGTSESSGYKYESYGYRPDYFGPLGYKKITITSDAGRKVTEINYSQDVENLKAGLVLGKVTRYFGDGLPASGEITEQVVNSWLVRTLDGVGNLATNSIPDIWDNDAATDYRYSIHLEGSTVSKYDLNGVSLGVSTATNTFDGFGNVLTTTASNTLSGQAFSTVTANTYDNDTTSWVLSRIRTAEVTESVTYNGITDSDTRKTAWTYYPPTHANWPGQIHTQSIEPDEVGGPITTNTFVYDELGLQRSITVDARDALSTTSWSYHDNRYRYINREVNSLGHEMLHYYNDELAKRSSSVGANGLSVHWTYDELGRVLTETAADGAITHTQYQLCSGTCYGAVHQVSKHVTGAAGAVLAPSSTVYFDEFGRQVATRSLGADGTPILTLAEFDAEGRELRSSEPFFDGDPIFWNTINARDLMGRITSQSTAGGLNQLTTFSGLQSISTSSWIDPLDSSSKVRAYTALVDLKGNKRQVTDDLNQVITYEYDAYGNQTAVNQPGGITISQTFDAYGRRVAMSDPDAGSWQYFYDGLGRLLLQENGAGQRVCMSYDKLGRMVTRTDDYQNAATWQAATASAAAGCSGQAVTTTWIYDTISSGKGRLDSVVHTGGYDRALTYDAIGRVTDQVVTYQSTTYAFGSEYDANGRLVRSSMPGIESGRALKTENIYNSQFGHLEAMKGVDPDGTADVVYWQLGATDARGNATEQFLQNGLIRVEQLYQSATGQVANIRAKRVADPDWAIQNMGFAFDAVGSLRQRDEYIGSQQQIEETFSFDVLGRLTDSAVVNLLDSNKNYTQSLTYGGDGNILTKSDVGSYSYGASCQVNGVTYTPGPHAVTSVNGIRNESYCYDNAGRMIRHNGKTISYNAFSKTTEILSADASMTFVYGPERELLQSSTIITGEQVTKVMLSGYEHITRTVAGVTTVEEKYYLSGNILVTVVDGADGLASRQEEFLFKDHIGSVVAVADAFGSVTSRMSFDPWGRRRDWVDWQGFSDSQWLDGGFLSETTQKGFTGHEMLDEVGLIHMGGRVYDPTLGRFLSTDPVVQQDYNLQNYNRYTYVLNNPVSYTDPTGYFLQAAVAYTVFAVGVTTVLAVAASPYIATAYFLARELGRLAAKNKFGGQLLQIVAVGGCVIGGGGPGCIAMASGWATTAVAVGNGASFSQALRLGVRAAAVAYVAASFAEGIGDATTGKGFGIHAEKAFAHGLNGTWASAAMGGEPLSGFASGMVSSVAGGYASGFDDATAAMITGMAGGLSSAAAGGKFEHGFMLGVVTYLFNHAGDHGQKRCTGRPCPSTGGSQNPYEPGLGDFLELLGDSFMNNFRVGSRLGAAFGTGVGVSADHDVDFQSHNLDLEAIKGAKLEWGLSIGGTAYSSGKIEGFYQGVEFRAWGGAKVIWDYQGNFAVSTSLAFPVSHGGGVVSGYATTGQEISDNLMR
ncbi:RHS repeat-associated core domain-containing protein [Alcanivorax sp. 1008]|uniref:RHS repeat-associated core domain-containing protein n=1 Tax=Alcanivorax sp. 1008 TaxID=2816853 RepID=UPI001D4F94A8|nr:RHS repeat-associated core domain-containing protein [Alcanivorax sp. 1008]MCC1495823.1 hypothetical protein [Alcanivorax sp. 1008]